MTNRPEQDYPHPHSEGQTHSEHCWQWPGHHNCAVAKVDVLQAKLAEENCDNCTKLVEMANDHERGLQFCYACETEASVLMTKLAGARGQVEWHEANRRLMPYDTDLEAERDQLRDTLEDIHVLLDGKSGAAGDAAKMALSALRKP